MRQSIEKAFPRIQENACLSIFNEAEFEIIDPETSICIVKLGHSNDGQLWVSNPKMKQIHFLAIDKCMFFDVKDEPSRCDCALFDETRICFVEIKDSNESNRRKRRKKAIDQLSKTINLFREKGIDFPQFDGLVCFSTSKSFPKRRMLSQEIEFLNECGGFLYEGNSETF
jgi:hypothetical protein